MKKIFVLIWTVAVALGLMSDQSFAQVQYLIDGKNPFTLHLETIPPNNCQTVTIALDPAGVIENPLISAGCGINYDVSQVLITNLVVADAAVG